MSRRALYLAPWRVDLEIRDGVAVPVPAARLARAVASALDAAGAPGPASIGLILTDDAELAGLNATHMGVSGPTDVLSFPLLPPTSFPAHPGGPSAAARPTARPSRPSRCRRARASISATSWCPWSGRPSRRRPAAAGRPATSDGRSGDELRLLVTHGTLHVCGWDHADPVEGDAMRALEQRLLAAG